MVVCLDVMLDDKSLFSTCDYESFDNEFEFIARKLAIKHKILYLIISTAMGDYVVQGGKICSGIPSIPSHSELGVNHLYT
jgi:hypothetical protein